MLALSDRAPDHRRGAFQVIDLFAGPGGLDVAAHWLGIPVAGIEWDDGACATRTEAGLATSRGDVRQYGPHQFATSNVLAAGPPCQTYTVAGRGSGRKALAEVVALAKRMSVGEDVSSDVAALPDERTGLVLEPLRWTIAAQDAGRPYDAIILEQVQAVLPVWRALEEALQGYGYHTTSGVLRAEEYGVPQTRKRAILIANRHFQPRLPSATHQKFSSHTDGTQFELDDRKPWVSMREALHLTPHFDRMLDFDVVSNYGSGGDPRARGRRQSTQPSATVTGKITRNRIVDTAGRDRGRFSRAEAGVLQTFPHDYPWTGLDISQQIGNAIPPRLAAHVIGAALGLEVDTPTLDRAVAMPWATSRTGVDASTGNPG